MHPQITHACAFTMSKAYNGYQFACLIVDRYGNYKVSNVATFKTM